MRRIIKFMGSIKIAVLLLVAIALVLAWGTIYETMFGTAAVQRFIYHAWWFQLLLGFLALNLIVALIERYPWNKRQLPFILAHIGIILILLGGIIGGRFGIEGQLIIPEGEAQRSIQLPTNVLALHEPDSEASHEIPTGFEATSWVHEPDASFDVVFSGRAIRLTVDRYYPDAITQEKLSDDGIEDNPAIRISMSHHGQEEEFWLLAKDPGRSNIGWGLAQVLFIEPKNKEQLDAIFGSMPISKNARGIVYIVLPGKQHTYEVPVPEDMGKTIALEGTPYAVKFNGYFSDFAITDKGPVSRSDAANNPAVSFTLIGPEGIDEHLLFAFYPDFASIHGQKYRIDAKLNYQHGGATALAPNAITFIRMPSGALSAVVTGEPGHHQDLTTLELGRRYTHPWLNYQFAVTSYYKRARQQRYFSNGSNEVKAEVLHLKLQDGQSAAETWLGLNSAMQLMLSGKPIVVEYRPAKLELPVTIKLLDFRRIDYPGSRMAAGYESDVQLTDTRRGLILMRKISMNNPLRYGHFSFFQSSYIPGEVETSVLAVKSDPGTPLVYTGFVVIIVGLVLLFTRHSKPKRKR